MTTIFRRFTKAVPTGSIPTANPVRREDPVTEATSPRRRPETRPMATQVYSFMEPSFICLSAGDTGDTKALYHIRNTPRSDLVRRRVRRHLECLNFAGVESMKIRRANLLGGRGSFLWASLPLSALFLLALPILSSSASDLDAQE